MVSWFRRKKPDAPANPVDSPSLDTAVPAPSELPTDAPVVHADVPVVDGHLDRNADTTISMGLTLPRSRMTWPMIPTPPHPRTRQARLARTPARQRLRPQPRRPVLAQSEARRRPDRRDRDRPADRRRRRHRDHATARRPAPADEAARIRRCPGAARGVAQRTDRDAGTGGAAAGDRSACQAIRTAHRRRQRRRQDHHHRQAGAPFPRREPHR